jgi:hypothetical protein
MIAGSVLVLAGAVLYAAHWLGRVIHNPVTAGAPDGWYLAAGAAVLGLIGGAVAAVGALADTFHDGGAR